MKGDELDPKGLIREAYLIEGISAPECRSIFLDWALSYNGDQKAAMSALLARHGTGAEDHPMTVTLQAGLDGTATARRRGGRSARVGGEG